MKATRFSSFLLAGLSLLFALSSCQKEPEKVDPYKDLKMNFTLTVKEVSENSAKIQVKHDADVRYSWFGFVTEDLEADIQSLVEGALNKVTADNLQLGGTKTITVSDLEMETQYRYIAFGVDAEKRTYGTPGEVIFSTSKDLNVIFSVSEPVIDKNSVKFEVSYDKDSEYTWYGFFVKDADFNKTTAQLFRTYAKDIPEADLQTGNPQEIVPENLEFSKEYRYVVTGLLPDGTTYGTPADIKFTTGSKYYVEESWKITFLGKKWRAQVNAYSASLNVESTTTPYDFFVCTKEAFNASTVVDLIEAEYEGLKETIAYYEGRYGWTDFISTEPSVYWGKYDGPGDYVAIAYGLAAPETTGGEYTLTGGYCVQEYTVEPGTATDAYNGWLGNWIAGDQTWEFEALDPGCIFAVKGVCNLPAKYQVKAQFYDGKIYLSEQYVGPVETITISGGGQIEAQAKLMGLFSQGLWGGSQLLFTATQDGQTATLVPQTVYASQPSYGNFTGCAAYFEPNDGGTTVYGISGMTRYQFADGLRRPSETGSEAYEKWFGDWDIIGRNVEDSADSTFFQVNISQDMADVSYLVSSDWGKLVNPVALKGGFRSSDGAFSFKIGTVLEDQKVFSDSDELFDVVLCGFFVYSSDGKTYYDDEAGSDLAFATLSGEDAVTVAAGYWDNAGTMPYIYMNLMAVNDAGAYRLWYPANLNIPFKMQKAVAAPLTGSYAKASVKKATWTRYTGPASLKVKAKKAAVPGIAKRSVNAPSARVRSEKKF